MKNITSKSVNFFLTVTALLGVGIPLVNSTHLRDSKPTLNSNQLYQDDQLNVHFKNTENDLKNHADKLIRNGFDSVLVTPTNVTPEAKHEEDAAINMEMKHGTTSTTGTGIEFAEGFSPRSGFFDIIDETSGVDGLRSSHSHVKRGLDSAQKSSSCVDDALFKFTSTNMKGVIKDKGGCEYVAKKKKKRCKKEINGVRVRDQCAAVCGAQHCTCRDFKTSFRARGKGNGLGKGKGKKMFMHKCKNIKFDKISRVCSNSKISRLCPIRCQFLGCLPLSYGHYIAQLQQSYGDGILPWPAPSAQRKARMMLSSPGPSFVQAELPDGVFDMNKVNDPGYMLRIVQRCASAINENSTASQVLGCHLLFDPSWPQQPLAIGTLNMGVNLFSSTQNGMYNRDNINLFFEDYALASMIDSGCFQLDTSTDAQTEVQYVFSDSESYTSSLKESSGFSIDVEAKGWGVTASSGYNTKSEDYTKNSRTEKYAYGENRWFASVGTLINICLVSQTYFEYAIVENKLVKDEWVQKWNAIKNADNAKVLAQTQNFIDIATGGLVMPSSYKYGAAVSYKIQSSYEAISSETSREMSNAIKAGLGASFSGTGGSVSTTVTNAVSTSAESSGITESTTVTTEAFGSGINTGCITEKKCPQLIVQKVAEMRENLNTLGNPYSHVTAIGLDDIVKWYTGDGLGDNFEIALNEYFQYTQCDDMNSASKTSFSTFNGSGERIAELSNSCGSEKICNSCYFDSMLISRDGFGQDKIKDNVCSALTYECDNPVSRTVATYSAGENGWKATNGDTGHCAEYYACVSFDEVYNPSDLCEATYKCKHEGANCMEKADGTDSSPCCSRGLNCQDCFPTDLYNPCLCKK